MRARNGAFTSTGVCITRLIPAVAEPAACLAGRQKNTQSLRIQKRAPDRTPLETCSPAPPQLTSSSIEELIEEFESVGPFRVPPRNF